MIAKLKKIGFEPGKSYDFASPAVEVRAALASAPVDAQTLMAEKSSSIAPVANGWIMSTDTMGVYGDNYLKRAIVVQSLLGANVPEDAIYPANLGDASEKPLDGTNRCTLHFDKGALPPIDGFWSVTLYGPKASQSRTPSTGSL
jgi:hypothetical protein